MTRYEEIETCKDSIRSDLLDICGRLDPTLAARIFPSISRTYEMVFSKDGRQVRPDDGFLKKIKEEYESTHANDRFNPVFHIVDNGIYVSYPRHEFDGDVAPFKQEAVFHESLERARKFNDTTGLSSIDGINDFIDRYGDVDFIQMCEMRMQMQMSKIVEKISNRNVNVIAVSGPSSSGKTTTANKIRIGLMAVGYRPLRLSLDDYYLKPEDCPVGPDGKKMLESIEALDLGELRHEIESLLSGKRTKLRTFDFKTKEVHFDREETWDPSQPIIIEGIHALNKRLLEGIEATHAFRVYISPHPQVCIDDKNVFPFSDVRLLRRLIRDEKTRSTSFEESLGMWNSVRNEEFVTIYSGEENADFVFDSFYPYELCAMHQMVVPKLKLISKDSKYYEQAQRLIRNLDNLREINLDNIPVNSTIREFIGGGSFKG